MMNISLKVAKSLFVIIFCFSSTHSLGEVKDSIPQVKYNRLTNNIDSELPFDREFFLKIVPPKEHQLSKLIITKGRKSLCNNEYFTPYEKRKILSFYGIEIDSTKISFRDSLIIFKDLIRENKFKRVEKGATFIKIYPLEPNVQYRFEMEFVSPMKINTKLGELVVSGGLFNKNDSIITALSEPDSIAIQNHFNDSTSFDDINKFSKKNDFSISNFKQLESYNLEAISKLGKTDVENWSSDLNLSKKEKEKLNEIVEKRFSKANLSIELQKINEDDILRNIKSYIANDTIEAALRTIINHSIKRGGKKIKSLSEKIENNEKLIDSSKVNILSFKNEYESLLKYSDSLYKSNKEKKLIPDSILYSLMIPKHTFLKSEDVSLGNISLTHKNTIDKRSNKYDYAQRKNNLDLTINHLEEIGKIIDLTQPDSTNYEQKIDSLLKTRQLVNENMLYLKELTDSIMEYKIANEYPLKSKSIKDITGYTHDDLILSSKGKFTIRPDLGVAIISNKLFSSEPLDPYTTFAPFIGVRFNFRPIDPDYTFSKIRPKNFAHRSSINVSYSFISISDGETRFNLHRNYNIMVGYGFRLNNAVNLSTGAFFFQREDPDPLITSKKLAALPYFAVTVDFEILETLENFINVFKN